MSELNFTPESTKEDVLNRIEGYIGDLSLKIGGKDEARPWGGFFVVAKESEKAFLQQFFPDLNHDQVYEYGQEISPKILVVAPNQELSWQYHDRRAEIWRVQYGPIGVVTSQTDDLGETKPLQTGELVQHGAGTRHRLIGLGNWGVLAEIWQHTDPAQPSNEDDIVRLQDNYGRSS